MPNERRTNDYQVAANWTDQYCHVSPGEIEAPTQAPTDPFTAASTASPTSTSVPIPSETSARSPLPIATTVEPSHSLTPSTSLLTFVSTCAASKCKADFDSCLKTFDNCACIPGQLSCVQIHCPEDWVSTISECTDAIALAKSCVLTCVAGVYPDKIPLKDSTVVMTVVSSIALSSLKVAKFKALEKEFKSALASTLSCSVDQINITNVTEESDRRRLLSEKSLPFGQHGRVGQRRLNKGGMFLNVEFEVTVSSAKDLKSTMSTLQGITVCRFKIKHCNNLLHRSSEWLNNFG